jgi:uncharacterized protein
MPTTCGNAVALEHNGDVYSCDHFVEPRYLRGQHHAESHLGGADRVKPEAARVRQAKLDTLPTDCRQCEVRFACNGECPKNRFILTADG